MNRSEGLFTRQCRLLNTVWFRVQGWLWISLLLLSTVHPSWADTAVTSASFQYQAALTEGKTSLRRAALPWEVLAAMQQPGQADLRVYNADDQLVPFSVRQPDSVSIERSDNKALSEALNFFSGDNAQHLSQWLANQPDISAGHIRELSADNRHYLIIPTQAQEDTNGDINEGANKAAKKNINKDANKNALTMLELKWQGSGLLHWLPKSLRVESSDDLLRWQPVTITGLPYALSERGVMLENRLIRFKQPLRSKFIRLSGGPDFAALLPVLQQVLAHYQREHQQQPALNWQTVALSPGDKHRQYRYNPPPALPVLQWRLALAQSGYLYEGALYGRRPVIDNAQQQAYSDWRYIRRFRQYELETAAGPVRSAAEPAGELANQQWLLQFNQPLAGGTEPALEIAWQPLELYFVAQGNGPFRLAYGNKNAGKVPAMQLDEKLMASAEKVQITEAVKLSEFAGEAVKEPFNWLTLLLWGVLDASVLLLLWMARRLWREMSGKHEDGAS